MNTIKRYELPVNKPETSIKMPMGAMILEVEESKEYDFTPNPTGGSVEWEVARLFIWALVMEGVSEVTREFRLYGPEERFTTNKGDLTCIGSSKYHNVFIFTLDK